jgi:hypothetical protein
MIRQEIFSIGELQQRLVIFMNKTILYLVVLLSFIISDVYAATYYIASDGSGSTCSEGSPCTFATAHAKGDVTTITAKGGTYTDSFPWDLNKDNVTLNNYSGQTPILDGEFDYPSAEYNGLINVTASGITVDGIHIIRSQYDGISIRGNDATSANIKNVYVGYCDKACIHTGTYNITHNNLIEDSTFEYGNYDIDRGSGSGVTAVVHIQGIGTTVKNCIVRYGTRAGVEDYKGENTIVEDCTIYGNAWTQVHTAATETFTIRDSIIYGTDRPEPIYEKIATWPTKSPGEEWEEDLSKGYGDGLAMMVEHWYNGANWDNGHIAHGNMIANTRRGIVLGFAYGAGCNPTDNPGCYPDNRIAGCEFYNNTIINPNGDEVDVEGKGSCIMVDNLEDSIGDDNIFKNNLCFQTDTDFDVDARRSSTFTSDQAEFDYNLWNREPTYATFKGSNDPNPYSESLSIGDYFTNTDGWNTLTAGSISQGDFVILLTAEHAIDQGVALSSEFNTDYFGNHRNIDTGWDIGALEYFDALFPIISSPDPYYGEILDAGTTSYNFTVSVSDATAVSGCRMSDSDESYADMSDDDTMADNGDGTWDNNLTGLTNDTSYTKYIACTDGTNAHTASNNFTSSFSVQSASGGTLLVDNSDSEYAETGTHWASSTAVAGYYGDNYRTSAKSNETATWTFTVPLEGIYRVDAQWTEAGNRPVNVDYAIVHSGGTAHIEKDQTQNGGSFQELGTWTFGTGETTVTLTVPLTGYACADAVRMVAVDTGEGEPNPAGSGSVTVNPAATGSVTFVP